LLLQRPHRVIGWICGLSAFLGVAGSLIGALGILPTARKRGWLQNRLRINHQINQATCKLRTDTRTLSSLPRRQHTVIARLAVACVSGLIVTHGIAAGAIAIRRAGVHFRLATAGVTSMPRQPRAGAALTCRQTPDAA
jgi:hypothetical protein